MSSVCKVIDGIHHSRSIRGGLHKTKQTKKNRKVDKSALVDHLFSCFLGQWNNSFFFCVLCVFFSSFHICRQVIGMDELFMHILHNTFLFCEYATEEHSSKSNNIVIRSVQYNMLLLLTFSNILLSVCMCEREYTFYRFTLTLFGEYKMYLYVQNSGCVRYREIGGMEWWKSNGLGFCRTTTMV